MIEFLLQGNFNEKDCFVVEPRMSVRIQSQNSIFQILVFISLHPLTHFINHGVYELSAGNERTCSIDKSLLFVRKKEKKSGRVKLDDEKMCGVSPHNERINPSTSFTTELALLS